ncbi:hypothetical protein P9112_008994 [Eukaryota sp. TZLM1-RC]
MSKTRYPTLGCLVSGLGKPQDTTSDPSQPSLATRIVRLLSELELDTQTGFSFKVCVIGDAAVGKTTLVNRLTKGEFSPFYHATVGVEYSTHEYVIEGCKITLQLWDTAGQESSLSSLTSNYFRNSHAALLCFDVSSPKSLSNVPQWCARVDDVCTNDASRPLLFVVGLKTDLRNSQSSSLDNHSFESNDHSLSGAGAWGCISKNEGGEVAAGISAEYLEASSRSGYGVEELFDRMAAVLLLRHLELLSPGETESQGAEFVNFDDTIPSISGHMTEGSDDVSVEEDSTKKQSCSC